MSAFAMGNFMEVLPDADHLNFWDGDFTNMHLYVPEVQRVVIDAAWAANAPGLAAEYLGSRYYSWVILMYNGLSDPINDLVPGTLIRIPDPKALGIFLSNRRDSRRSGNYLPTVQVTTL